MRHCTNEGVELYETQGEELAPLLREAANLVESHDGPAVVKTDPQVDPDTGRFGYVVTAYLHG